MLYSNYSPAMFTAPVVLRRGTGLSELDKQFIRRFYPFPEDGAH